MFVQSILSQISVFKSLNFPPTLNVMQVSHEKHEEIPALFLSETNQIVMMKLGKAYHNITVSFAQIYLFFRL